MPKTFHPKPPKPRAPERWTEAKVFSLLRGPFPAGAFVLLPQVRNGTGFTRRTRTADALIASCWPSRGLWFAGVEIKVCLADWRRELERPDKSAEIQKWCHYWYVAAPAGVIPLGELPPTWGLIECTAKTAKIVKPAPRLKPKPADAAFVCSVLRAAGDAMVPRAEVEPLIQERAEAIAKTDSDLAERWRQKVENFEKHIGIGIDSWNYGDIAAAVELLKRTKGSAGGVRGLAAYMKREAERLVRSGCEVMALCDAALAEPPTKVPAAIAPFVAVDDE